MITVIFAIVNVTTMKVSQYLQFTEIKGQD